MSHSLSSLVSDQQTRSLFRWLSAGHWANDFGPGAIWIIAPAIAVAMGLTPGELGLLIAIHTTGSALAYLPAGIYTALMYSGSS